MSRNNLIIFAAFILIASVCIVIFLRNGMALKDSAANSAGTDKKPVEVTLEFWGLWDSSDSWQPIIEKFEKENHNWNGQDVKVKINYSKKDIASYEAAIKDAYAGNTSPSIFLISNYWLRRYVSQLEPLTGNVAYTQEYGLLDYEKLTDIFPTNILQDTLDSDNQMYALPIYSDSLALYYNKDLFQKAGIEAAPTTWDELKADVKKLTLLDKKNVIKQSGIALGNGKNVDRSCDIMALLTMQGGGKVVDANGNADFNKKVEIKTAAGTVEREPGLTAIQFFSEFSDPNKEIYSWNDSFTNSVQAFAEGKTAMMIGYSYQKANLLALKPELNYGISSLPQIPNSTPMNISNAWFPVVSNQKSCTVDGGDAADIDCSKIAWSFLSFMNEKENINAYLKATGKAPARTDLISEQAPGEDKVSAFAKQATITRSYNKFDDRIDGILNAMLDGVYSERGNWKTKATDAATQIEALKNKTNQ